MIWSYFKQDMRFQIDTHVDPCLWFGTHASVWAMFNDTVVIYYTKAGTIAMLLSLVLERFMAMY